MFQLDVGTSLQSGGGLDAFDASSLFGIRCFVVPHVVNSTTALDTAPDVALQACCGCMRSVALTGGDVVQVRGGDKPC